MTIIRLNGVIDIIGIETTPVQIDMINVLLTHVLIRCSYDCKLAHSVGVEDRQKKGVKIDELQHSSHSENERRHRSDIRCEKHLK